MMKVFSVVLACVAGLVLATAHADPSTTQAPSLDASMDAAAPNDAAGDVAAKDLGGWRKIVERVPVFVLAGPDGAPLLMENQVAGVFLEPGDAETFLAVLRLRQPSPPAGVRVMPTSLEAVMQSAASGALAIAYIPKEANVTAAKRIKASSAFTEAPLFVVQMRGDGKPGFVTTRQAGEEVVLAFLDYPDAMRHAEKVRAAQGSGSPSVFVAVTGLSGFLSAARTDPTLSRVRIVPSASARAAAALRQ